MFVDMDQSLREMGVGDLSVGKRVKDMGKALLGRIEAYDKAFSAEYSDIQAAIIRNIYRGDLPHLQQIRRLIKYSKGTIENLASIQKKISSTQILVSLKQFRNMWHSSTMKQHKSEMPFLWKPKGSCQNSKEQFFLKASKSQKKLIAARLGLKALNDLEVKIVISQKDHNLFLVNGNINAEICKAVENSNESEDFVVNDGFQEIIQLNVPADRLEVLAKRRR